MLDFILHCIVVNANMFLFRLKENLACIRFFLSCSVVIGDIYMFVISKCNSK